MIVGVDIGGTTTKIGVIEDGRVVGRNRINTQNWNSLDVYITELANAIRALVPDQIPHAIGIGAPNGNQLTNRIEDAPNMPWPGTLPVAELLSEQLEGVRCVLGNDANAAALGVWSFELERSCSDLLVITLGTGLGSGVIIDNKLLLGARGNAGELGHSNIVIDGRRCTCGLDGCLEAYVSIRGIQQTYSDLGGVERARMEEVEIKSIAQAAISGSDIALQTFEHTARWLATGLSNAVAILAPEKIVLTGGISQSGPVLLEPTRRYLETYIPPMHRDEVALVTTTMDQEDLALLGAAALAY